MVDPLDIGAWGKTIRRPTLDELPQQDRDVHAFDGEMMQGHRSARRVALLLGISFDEVRTSMRRLVHRSPSVADGMLEMWRRRP